MKKLFSIKTVILAGSLLQQLSTFCLHSYGAAGEVDLSFNPGTNVNDSVRAIAVQPDGKLLFLRWFIFPSGPPGIGRLLADGSEDSSFNLIPGNWNLLSLTLQPDGRIVTAPLMNRFNADGSADTNFQAGFGVLQYFDCGNPQYECYTITYATAVAAQPDGKLLVGVASTYYYGCDHEGCAGQVNNYGLARFNADGSRDTNFAGAGPVGHVSAIAVQPDGKIFIGCDGFTTNRIIRLLAGGGVDTSFTQGVGPDASVKLVAPQADGKVLIAGGFTATNGTNFYRVVRLNANGSLDFSFDPNTVFHFNDFAFADLHAMAVQTDGKVLIGGLFTAVNGTNRNNIARLNADGSLDTSFNPGTGADGTVRSIALQPDGKVLIGGDFTTINGMVRPYVARLYGDAVAPSLNIARSNALMIISWPSSSTGFVLQQNTNLNANLWTTPTETITDNGTTKSISVSPASGNRFFRLFKP